MVTKIKSVYSLQIQDLPIGIRSIFNPSQRRTANSFKEERVQRSSRNIKGSHDWLQLDCFPSSLTWLEDLGGHWLPPRPARLPSRLHTQPQLPPPQLPPTFFTRTLLQRQSGGATLETSSKKIVGGENKTNTTFLSLKLHHLGKLLTSPFFKLWWNCFRKHAC